MRLSSRWKTRWVSCPRSQVKKVFQRVLFLNPLGSQTLNRVNLSLPWDSKIPLYKNLCFSSENSKLHRRLNSQDVSAAWRGQNWGISRPYFSCRLHLLLPLWLWTNYFPSHQAVIVMPPCPTHKLMKRSKKLVSG